jgi:ferredoxin
MSSKYMIHTTQIPHRFEPITRSGVIAWEEGCLKCAVCVKTQCVYGVYEKRDLNAKQMIDSLDNQCMSCFRCVQSCPKELIHKSINPEFKAMGDTHWTPEIISRLWYQAETGKIPVSGAGYPGPFTGPGFDSMWTDMSEIVRPTRDGIHGREYISTAVDIGGTPKYLRFTAEGKIENSQKLINLPIPIILRMPSFGAISEKTIKGWAMAASRLGIFLALPYKKISRELEELHGCLIPIIAPDDMPKRPDEDIRMVELIWSEEFKDSIEQVRRIYPGALISVRIPLKKGVEERVLKIIETGCSIINLEGTYNGRTQDDESGFLKDGIRSVHNFFVNEGVRDEITFLACGGLAMAEHVAKSIICGVDAVYADFPILIALECRMCRRCEQGLSCPVKIENTDPKWVGSRTLNIIGAWHNQLLEVMGAMGIRDVRRLRGEVGRAMFYEELDRDIFGKLGRIEEGFEIE